MKFCTKCGHELNNEAVVCVNCGCMTNEGANITTMQKTEALSATMPKQNKSILLIVMNFVSTIAAIISIFYSLFAVFKSDIFSYYSTIYRSVSTYFRPNYDLSALGFIFALVALIFGLVCFILTLVKKAGIKSLLNSIAHMVFGLFFIILNASVIFL